MSKMIAFFLLLAVIYPSHSYMITVDAHAEECFMEKVTSGTKLGKCFEAFLIFFEVFTLIIDIKCHALVTTTNQMFKKSLSCKIVSDWVNW